MSTKTQTELNQAQTCIYSKSNIARAYPDIEAMSITDIQKDGDQIVINGDTRLDAKPVQEAFTEFTNRVPHFFEYLSPTGGALTPWRDQCYVLWKGWSYTYPQRKNLIGLQNFCINKGIHKIPYIDGLQALIQPTAKINCKLHEQEVLKPFKLPFEECDLGYVVAPDGMGKKREDVDLLTPFKEDVDEDEVEDKKKEEPEPWCSCPSFQKQLRFAAQYKEEIKDYRIGCKHLSWIRKFRHISGLRTRLHEEAKGNMPDQAVAWGFKPPTQEGLPGQFKLLYTKSGYMAPARDWRWYKPDQNFTEEDAWPLFTSMLNNGYTYYTGSSLSQIAPFF